VPVFLFPCMCIIVAEKKIGTKTFRFALVRWKEAKVLQIEPVGFSMVEEEPRNDLCNYLLSLCRIYRRTAA
jgi:hypothetical protein